MNKVLFCIWSCTKVGVIFTMMLSGGSHTYIGRSWFAHFNLYLDLQFLSKLLLTNNL